eukprot:gene25226-biopygen9006
MGEILSLARRRECTIHKMPHVGAFLSSRQRQNFLRSERPVGRAADSRRGRSSRGGAKSISQAARRGVAGSVFHLFSKVGARALAKSGPRTAMRPAARARSRRANDTVGIGE